jgi:hypothetical protein
MGITHNPQAGRKGASAQLQPEAAHDGLDVI